MRKELTALLVVALSGCEDPPNLPLTRNVSFIGDVQPISVNGVQDNGGPVVSCGPAAADAALTVLRGYHRIERTAAGVSIDGRNLPIVESGELGRLIIRGGGSEVMLVNPRFDRVHVARGIDVQVTDQGALLILSQLQSDGHVRCIDTAWGWLRR